MLRSHQPPLSRRTRDRRRRFPAHDALHLHIHRKGNGRRRHVTYIYRHHRISLTTTINKPKEKQAESIVEKLCQRFRLSEDTRQWRDIAFCLSLLPFKSERSVKKLIEGLPFYRDKLHEEGVYARFQEILVKVRTRLWQANARTALRIPSLPFSHLIFRITLKLLTFTLRQARSNKAANKPDSELNEFETVRLLSLSLSLSFFSLLILFGNVAWRGVAHTLHPHTYIYGMAYTL